MRADTLRIGTGFDVHPLRRGRLLLLGGEQIPFSHGLGGHSDADVLLHAICDSLLGAAAQGDIGRHFPEHDPAYRDISSLELLRRVLEVIGRVGLRVVQIDSCVLAEAPKLSPYYPAMQRNIAQCLKIPENCVGIKASTTEGLGFIGRGEGIAAQAVCLLAPAPRRKS